MAGLLSILDEVTAGGLIVPAGEALAPTVAAVEWAEAGSGSGSEEDIPESAWQLLGVPAHGSQLVKAIAFKAWYPLGGRSLCHQWCEACVAGSGPRDVVAGDAAAARRTWEGAWCSWACPRPA